MVTKTVTTSVLTCDCCGSIVQEFADTGAFMLHHGVSQVTVLGPMDLCRACVPGVHVALEDLLASALKRVRAGDVDLIKLVEEV